MIFFLFLSLHFLHFLIFYFLLFLEICHKDSKVGDKYVPRQRRANTQHQQCYSFSLLLMVLFHFLSTFTFHQNFSIITPKCILYKYSTLLLMKFINVLCCRHSMVAFQTKSSYEEMYFSKSLGIFNFHYLLVSLMLI